MKFTDTVVSADITMIDEYGRDQSDLIFEVAERKTDDEGAYIVDDMGDCYEWFTDVVNHTGIFKDATAYHGLKLYLEGELVAEEKKVLM